MAQPSNNIGGWLGVRQNLQETIVLPQKNRVPAISLQPISGIKGCWLIQVTLSCVEID